MLKYIRYLLVAIVIFIYSIIGTVVVLLFWTKKSLINDWVAYTFGNSAQFILGIKNIFKNKALLYQQRPCIYISNHQSNLDAWTIISNHPGNTITLGKKEIAYIPFFGWLYFLLGHILINRQNKMSSRETINTLARQLKEKNISIWILPEGTRSKGRGMLPFKKGPFHLAIDSGLPIIPVAISSYHKNLNLNKWKSGTVLFKALPIIETKKLTHDDIDSLTLKCHDLIKKAVEELDEEIKLSGE